MIERAHLTILREVERQGSLTSAADKLCLTQSALSHTIKKLEGQFETKLWIKEGRRLKLTQAGEFLLKEANRLLPQLERVDETLRHFASGQKGALRIGMECHPCYQWLLTILDKFIQAWPEVEVDVKQRFQFGGMAALYNRDIDLLITPDPLERKGVNFTPVFDYELVLVVASTHALAKNNWVSAKDLCSQTLYTYPVEAERLDIYSQFLLPANCLPKTRKTIETTEIILQFVASNRGVAALPRWLVEKYEQEFNIRALRLGHKGIYKQIHLGQRSHLDVMSYANAIIKLAQKQQDSNSRA